MANDRSVMDDFVAEAKIPSPVLTSGRIVTSGPTTAAGQLKFFSEPQRVQARAVTGAVDIMREDGSVVDTMGDLFPLIDHARSIADAAGLAQAEPRVRVITSGGDQILGLRLTW